MGRLWRGQCHSEPEPIERTVRQHAGDEASIGIETGPMTPWLVHELRARGLNVVCLDARHASAALKMQMNKTDQRDAEGLAQIMRTGWYRSVHVKSLDAHRTRALLGDKGATRWYDNTSVEPYPGGAEDVRNAARRHTWRSVRQTCRGLCSPIVMRIAAIVRPSALTAWRQLREQIAGFRQGSTHAGQERPDVPTFDERAWYRGGHRSGLRQRPGRGPGPLCPIAVGRRAPGTDTKTI